jgi:hypothetical protein
MHLTDELLNEYLDEALEAEARARAASHLAGCAECAARLATLRALFTTLDALPEVPLDRDLSAAVVARLPRATPEWRPAIHWLIVAQAVAAVLLLAFAAPVIIGNLAPAGVSVPGQRIAQFTLDLLAGLQAQWQSLLGTLAWLSTQGLAGVRAVTEPLTEASTVLPGGVAAGLAVLWLAGNGVLLRSTLATRSH